MNNSFDLKSYIRDIPDFPKPGIMFRDITPLLASAGAFRASIEMFAKQYRAARVDVIVAAETRGFIFAAPLAVALCAGFVPIRKPEKLLCDVLGSGPNEEIQVFGRTHQPVEAHGGRTDEDVLEARFLEGAKHAEDLVPVHSSRIASPTPKPTRPHDEQSLS